MSKNLKIFVIFCLIALSQVYFSQLTYEKLEEAFFVARSTGDIDKMKELISVLESANSKDSKKIALLAEILFEYSNTVSTEREKRNLIEKSLNYGEEAIKLDSKNGRAWYISALCISRKINFTINPFEKLSLLNKFDSYIQNAIELLDNSIYKAFALLGSAIRYREPPWPFNNYSEAEKRFSEAIRYFPSYPPIYLELGFLYLKTGDRLKAAEVFTIASSMKPHPLFLKATEEAIMKAKEELKKLK